MTEGRTPSSERGPYQTCLHCGQADEADGDHTCPCPHPDGLCPDHMYAWACPVCGFWQADARYEQHVCKQAKNYRPDLYGPMTDVNENGYGWHDPKPATEVCSGCGETYEVDERGNPLREGKLHDHWTAEKGSS